MLSNRIFFQTNVKAQSVQKLQITYYIGNTFFSQLCSLCSEEYFPHGPCLITGRLKCTGKCSTSSYCSVKRLFSMGHALLRVGWNAQKSVRGSQRRAWW